MLGTVGCSTPPGDRWEAEEGALQPAEAEGSATLAVKGCPVLSGRWRAPHHLLPRAAAEQLENPHQSVHLRVETSGFLSGLWRTGPQGPSSVLLKEPLASLGNVGWRQLPRRGAPCCPLHPHLAAARTWLCPVTWTPSLCAEPPESRGEEGSCTGLQEALPSEARSRVTASSRDAARTSLRQPSCPPSRGVLTTAGAGLPGGAQVPRTQASRSGLFCGAPSGPLWRTSAAGDDRPCQ